MASGNLIKAWIMLVTLSGATTLATLIDAARLDSRIVAAAVLALAGLKARIILASYLGLARTLFWTRVFDSGIGLFLLLALALYLTGSTSEVGSP